MANTKASFAKSVDEEIINHYGAVRMHVTGSASLQLNLFSLDDVNFSKLLPLTIQPKNNIEPTRLSNFIEQKARLEIRTININETFQISKIIVFVRPVAKSYPQ